MTESNDSLIPQPDSTPELQLIPELGVPTIDEVKYRLEIAFNQVWPSGSWANDVRADFTESPKKAMEIAANLAGTTLAWVNFYARAVVSIKHSPEVLGERTSYYGLEEDGTERLWGNRVDCADAKYLVDRTANGLVFLTKEQILDEGSLRPYMHQWLGALVHRGTMNSTDIKDFSHLLRD